MPRPRIASLLTISAATVACSALCLLATPASAQLTLGSFTSNTNQFGNTLTESDGGTFRNGNYLNIVNADPGNPGALTGANFDTGIANIGFSGNPVYTIGYNTPIVNGLGNDLGVVVSFDTPGASPFTLSVSTDGINFSAAQTFSSGQQTTGVVRNYFYAGGGPYPTTLSVVPVDLSSFSIAAGQAITAVRLTGSSSGADIIRIAGFGTAVNTAAPEPGSLALLLPVMGTVGIVLRRRRK